MTLRSKIILLVMAISLVGGMGATFVLSFMIHRTLDNELEVQAGSAIQALATQVVQNVIDEEVLEARYTIEQLVENADNIEYAYITDFQGKLFAHSFGKDFPRELAAGPFRYHSTSEKPETKHFKTNLGLIMDVASPMIDGMIGHIHVGMNEDLHMVRLQAMRHRIIGLTLILAMAGTALAFYMSRSMTQPLSNLAKAMRLFGEGEKGRMVEPQSGGRETKQLTHAFNRMLADRQVVDLALQESEDRIRATFNSISDAIFLHPLLKEGFAPFFEVNATACERYGYTREEFIKLAVPDISESFDANYHSSPAKRGDLLESGQMVFESTHITKSGTIFPVEIHSTMIELGGRPVILSVVRDISERKLVEKEQKKLQAQLTQAQKMDSIGRLAGGVAHDFNNMLTIILGHSDMALQGMENSHPLYSDLKQIRQTSLRSASLTRQLLAFARKETIAPRLLDLNDSVEEMLKMMRRLIGEDIDLAWLPGAHVWPVKIDPSQLDQILANLCVNSRDAIKNVGKVTIETNTITFDESYCAEHPGFVPGDFVLLAVSDNGSGMGKETLKNIFEPFFTTKELGEGTGLGLATVYGICKQNDGFINVYSEPGHGTTFRIYLPRQSGQVEQNIPVHSTEVVTDCKETILVVEDETCILELTANMLENQGYDVLTASTPTEAMGLAAEHAHEIQLLITDVVLPEMNGRDLAHNLMSRHPGLKCLYMSGFTANVITHHSILDGGVNFIQKPFSYQDLTANVRVALDG